MLVKEMQALLAQMNPDDIIHVALFKNNEYQDLYEIKNISQFKYQNGNRDMTWATLEVEMNQSQPTTKKHEDHVFVQTTFLK